MASTMTITNPATQKSVKVRVFDVDTREAADVLAKDGAKALSWMLLGQKHSVKAMEDSDGGDSAANNFALNVVENALDWSLGLAVNRFIRDALAAKRCPRAFKVGASRKGDVFIIVPRKSTPEPWVAKY